ncbi:hypothetical protein FHT09_001727 [Xanthomonas arboricola]|nr:hypothetical protein [Xanthomonas sp. CFBP 8152]
MLEIGMTVGPLRAVRPVRCTPDRRLRGIASGERIS